MISLIAFEVALCYRFLVSVTCMRRRVELISGPVMWSCYSCQLITGFDSCRFSLIWVLAVKVAWYLPFFPSKQAILHRLTCRLWAD